LKLVNLYTGCRVVLACRNAQKADAAAEKLRAEVSGAQVRVVHLNLASLKSVKQCAELLNNTENSIHLLINNAGKLSARKNSGENSKGFA
jgi:NAD(P)-dependent dehydrogenase (short-subunit alcohol dehydrogenase family)